MTIIVLVYTMGGVWLLWCAIWGFTHPHPKHRTTLPTVAAHHPLPLSTVSAADLLEPDTADTPRYEVPKPSRRSSLQGRSLPARHPLYLGPTPKPGPHPGTPTATPPPAATHARSSDAR